MENVQTVKVELEVGKETKEVADCLRRVIEDIRAKKPIAEIASGNLSSLYTAVEGFDKVDDEFKHKTRNQTGAYAGLQLTEALVPVKEEA